MNVEEFVLVTVSDPINPYKDSVAVAAEEPSYTLFDAEAVAVNALADISAVVDVWAVIL